MSFCFFGKFFRFFLVAAITSVEGACHCACFFFFVRLCLPACLGCLPALGVPPGLPWVPAGLRCLPALGACLPWVACLGCLPVMGACWPWVPAGLPWVPALGACLPWVPACLGCLLALGACWPWVPAVCLGCLPTLGACLPWVPAGLGCVPACLGCRPALGACRPALGACLPWVPAGLGCLPTLGARWPWVPAGLPWVPAGLPWVPACLGCLLALGAWRPWVPAGMPWVPAWPGLGCLPAFCACLPWVPAGVWCLPALGACLPWVPAGLGCLPAGLGCRPLNVSTTSGTVPLTMVTAQHDRIPSQPCGHFCVSRAFQVGGSRMAGARQAQGRVGPRVAPIGLELCGRSLRHRQVHEHQVRIGRTWTPSEMIPHFCFFDFLARQGAGVCSVSLGACVASFDSTTVTGHALPDICFMVSPSCIIVMVICSVLTHRLCLWLVSILRFFFPVFCVQLVERLLNLVIVLTSVVQQC